MNINELWERIEELQERVADLEISTKNSASNGS